MSGYREICGRNSRHGSYEEISDSEDIPYRKKSDMKSRAEYNPKPEPRGERLHCRTIDWQHGKYVKDDCGEGIVSKVFDKNAVHRMFCETGLTTYQATHGELARKLLCRETIIPRKIQTGPPCNVCEHAMPPCRGYYRKEACMKPCEKKNAKWDGKGKRIYRDPVERYWDPCYFEDEDEEERRSSKVHETYAHNIILGNKLRKKFYDQDCW